VVNNSNDKMFGGGALELDTKTRQVFADDVEIQLTQREFDLLLTFMQHPGEVMTRDDLLDAVWGTNFDGQINIVDVYVRYLCNKLKESVASQMIQTIRGVGYKLGDGDEENAL